MLKDGDSNKSGAEVAEEDPRGAEKPLLVGRSLVDVAETDVRPVLALGGLT